jgi:hypothetical protein
MTEVAKNRFNRVMAGLFMSSALVIALLVGLQGRAEGRGWFFLHLHGRDCWSSHSVCCHSGGDAGCCSSATSVEFDFEEMNRMPNKSLEPTAAPLMGLARLAFRADGSSGCGSALIR